MEVGPRVCARVTADLRGVVVLHNLDQLVRALHCKTAAMTLERPPAHVEHECHLLCILRHRRGDELHVVCDRPYVFVQIVLVRLRRYLSHIARRKSTRCRKPQCNCRSRSSHIKAKQLCPRWVSTPHKRKLTSQLPETKMHTGAPSLSKPTQRIKCWRRPSGIMEALISRGLTRTRHLKSAFTILYLVREHDSRQAQQEESFT